jgi:hypothetical protein
MIGDDQRRATMRRRTGERARRGLATQGVENRSRAAGVVVLACLAIVGCTPPMVFAVATTRPAYDVHQCVTENLVRSGFRVVESRRDDGIVRAERQGTILGFLDHDELDIIDVVIFEQEDGRTGIQYTAGRLILDEGGRLEGPKGDVEAIADRVATYCSD